MTNQSLEITRPKRIPQEVRLADIAELETFIKESLQAAAEKHGLPISYSKVTTCGDWNRDVYSLGVRMGHCDIAVNIEACQSIHYPNNDNYICSAGISFTGVKRPFHDFKVGNPDNSPSDSVKSEIHKADPGVGTNRYENGKRRFLEALDKQAAQIKNTPQRFEIVPTHTILYGGTSELVAAYMKATGITSREAAINVLLKEAMREEPTEPHVQARKKALAALNGQS